MQRHFLLAIRDESPSWGLRFLRQFFTDTESVVITLAYVPPRVYKGDSIDTVQTATLAQKGQVFLEENAQWIIERGFPAKGIHTKVLSNTAGVVQTIVQEAHKELYDAVIVGRRYLSWLERKYTTSVSRGILWESIDFPLWVSHAHEDGRKNIVFCVDCTESTTRMADHIGFIMGIAREHDVTLLHFESKGCDSEQAFASARNALRANGVEDFRISTLSTTSMDISQSILRIADEEKFAVVAIAMEYGKQNSHGGIVFPKIIQNSVASELHENVKGFSLWVNQ